MINKLMRMEERIVLDGSVAVAVATAGAVAGEGAPTGGVGPADVAADPVDENDDSGSEGGIGDDVVGGSEVESSDGGEQSDVVDAGLDGAIEALDAISGSEPDLLKAIIINSKIDDIDDLIGAVGEGVFVIKYDGDTADLQGILAELDELSGGKEYGSIAIATHGDDSGRIAITYTEVVSAESLLSDAEQIAFFSGLGKLIAEDGRIDLLACDSGQGDDGDALIAAIAEVSGAKVAASVDTTGNEEYGGDWILEKGNIDAEKEYFDDDLASFDGTLPYYNIIASPIYAGGSEAGDFGEVGIGFRSFDDGGYEHTEYVKVSGGATDDVAIKVYMYSEVDAGYFGFEECTDDNITYGELKEMLGTGCLGASFSVDLNNVSDYFEFEAGERYKLVFLAGVFERHAGGDRFTAEAECEFTLPEGVDKTVDRFKWHNNNGDNGLHLGQGDQGDGLGGDGPLGGPIGGLLGGVAGGPLGGLIGDVVAGGGDDAGQGDGGGDGEGEGGEGQGEGDDGNAGGSVVNRGAGRSPDSMMVSNPFAEVITSREVQVLFDSTIDAFAGLGMDTPAIYSMLQDAMGDTMTTAALISSCEQCLDSANELLADMVAQGDSEMALSGSGMTAEADSVAGVVQEAIGNMVQARGNALIANDLLRILSLDISDFSERLAENSFSAGITRLAANNEELAYSYEVLNGVCKVVQEHRESGESLTASELRGMMPVIMNNAKEVSLNISENGDRASKDVLAFLTRQMQNEGVDTENLQEQVSAVFAQWHGSLGVSSPVNMPGAIDADVAEGESIPADAM